MLKHCNLFNMLTTLIIDAINKTLPLLRLTAWPAGVFWFY